MTVEEMITFDINNCTTLFQHNIETKIVDGVYTVSQKFELGFNEDEIKNMLLMFKPMQKELNIYKKAFEQACKRIALYDDWDWQDWKEYILNYVRSKNNDI